MVYVHIDQDIHKVKIGQQRNTLISELAEWFFAMVFMSMFSAGWMYFSKKNSTGSVGATILDLLIIKIVNISNLYKIHSSIRMVT